ncbi:hypothetical protein GDO86_016716 [Hymenochirus boettgeri]|uniref:Insulin-induced gene protein n=1 Tax=Hymenochirus boettgeri TaxID=247094 RepID=A0A8T2INS0_9PIPI|nr:hypothetical protein GDO86_016716 [Hymenochirus boettgeri]
MGGQDNASPVSRPLCSRYPGPKMNLMIRGLLLFLIGVFLALVLNLLQVQRNVTLFPPDVLSSLFSSAWWVPLCCGTAAAAIGLLYPCIDRQLGTLLQISCMFALGCRVYSLLVGSRWEILAVSWKCMSGNPLQTNPIRTDLNVNA